MIFRSKSMHGPQATQGHSHSLLSDFGIFSWKPLSICYHRITLSPFWFNLPWLRVWAPHSPLPIARKIQSWFCLVRPRMAQNTENFPCSDQAKAIWGYLCATKASLRKKIEGKTLDSFPLIDLLFSLPCRPGLRTSVWNGRKTSSKQS